ncbi:MAG: class I poly(R)-hydroxyalkanoic acid synthase [Pseudomonadota bacterium]
MEEKQIPDTDDRSKIAVETYERYQTLLHRLVSALANKPVTNQKLESPGLDLYTSAFQVWMKNCAENPEKAFEQQVAYWRETATNYFNAQQAAYDSSMRGSSVEDQARSNSKDRRFTSPYWDKNPWLKFVRDQYLTTARATSELVASLENLDAQDRKRLRFFSQQITDMFAPTNFFSFNPDAMQKAYETGGTSLLDGFENFVQDIEANKGRHAVTLADPDAFEVGINLATTPGKVVFRNQLFELIQYSATTKRVYEKPLVIIPPWINKYYILDLKPQNSFIKYAADAGLTVFVVSWVNPDASYRDVGFDDYVYEGAVKAIDTVCTITDQDQVNAIGYCIGGTLLATALAAMAKGNHRLVSSATFFTTLLDFREPGEITAFFGGDMLEGLKEEIDRQGFLDAYFMARAFSYLRANDLVYGPGVKSYLLGEKPPAFDLLYWNGDSTNLPAKMAHQYLERLYHKNELMHGTFSVGGNMLDLKDIDIPVTAVATRTDHIAPWASSFSGISEMSGEKQLILSDSGHIAGIVNPPSAEKYCYWLNDRDFDPEHADQWFKNAKQHHGSWWPVWLKWLTEQSGNKISARKPGTKDFPALMEAPGDYVKLRAS